MSFTDYDFPHTNMYDSDLREVIANMRKLEEIVATFVSNNTIEFADPIQWNITTQYKKSVIVLDKNGNAFLSKEPVPAGIELSNEKYWLEIFNFMDYVKSFNSNLTYNVETNTERATDSYLVGDWLIWEDILYKVTAIINLDDLLVVGTNIERFTVEEFCRAWQTYMVNTINQYKNDIDASELAYKNEIDASEAAYRAQLAEDIATITASLQAQLDTAISGATVDSEVINGRVGEDSIVYDTLGNAIRTQVKDLKTGYKSDLVDNIQLLGSTDKVVGKVIYYYNGVEAINVDWSYYNHIPVKEGQYLEPTPMINCHIAFFDGSGTYISGVQSTVAALRDILVPTGAVYCSYSWNHVNVANPYLIVSPTKYRSAIDPRFKTLSKNVSLSFINTLDYIKLGKNLFNKFNAIDDSYTLYYGNGARSWDATGYSCCFDLVPVKPSTTYSFNANMVAGEYDEDLECTYTHNYTTIAYNNGGTFTTQATSKYMRIATRVATKDTFMVWEGTDTTTYEPFTLTPLGLNVGQSVKFITVKSDGTGDYTTISDAVADANNDDIILVYEGTYVESVHASTKKIHIIGIDRTKCILEYSGLDRLNPPLEIAKGSVRNMTIHATNTGTPGANPAYCVHIDYNSSEGESLYFENCEFYNEVHQAVGIGLRHNFTLTFDNCVFRTAYNCKDALYCHDWETSDPLADHSGQVLIVRDCEIIANDSSRSAILLQSQELATDCAIVHFCRNIVRNLASPSAIAMYNFGGRTLTNNSYLGSSDWVLANDSALNTSPLMNDF